MKNPQFLFFSWFFLPICVGWGFNVPFYVSRQMNVVKSDEHSIKFC